MELIHKLFGSTKQLNKDDIGKLGENYSVHYLQKNNYHIIKTNYRSRLGEIDIIARFQESIIFVEVKTREEHLTFGQPVEAVTGQKQNRIKKMAQNYLDHTASSDWKECRFDVIEVIVSKAGKLKSINHIRDAF